MSDQPTAKKKLTPKQLVLKKYPAAFSFAWKDGSVCVLRPFLGGNLNLGHAKGAIYAWKDALKNIRSGKA